MSEVKKYKKGDHYPTPDWATEAIIQLEGFKGPIWEPACGTGNMSNVLMKFGHDVYSSDLLDYGFGEPNVDFLIENSIFASQHKVFDNIVTNPPFNVALDFILMAKRYSNHKIAMLLKTTFIETVERREMFKDKAFPFKGMYQFVRRLTFFEENTVNRNGGMMSFAWFVWEKGYTGKPTIDWID